MLKTTRSERHEESTIMRARLKVREIAEKKGVSRTGLHHSSEVAYGKIRVLFQNPYTDLRLTTISRLAHGLGVTTAELIEDVTEEVYEAEMAAIKAAKAARRRTT
jgi:hypothetical protein